MASISSISSGQSADSIRKDYLNLLITQLQNQNPLDPMDNGEMASQLAQLAQLEQVEAVNNKFDQVLTLSNRVQAAGLIGKEVAFVPADADEPVWATVSAVQMIDGQPVLRAGGHDISLEGIKLIRNPQEEQ